MSEASVPRFPPLMRWIVWAALTASLGVYLVVLRVVDRSEPSESPGELLRNVLYLIGLAQFGLGQGIKYLANHLRTPEGEPKRPDWIDGGFIAALAVTEAVGIFGLVLAFMGGSPKEFLPLFVLSFVGMLLLNPKSYYAVEQRAE